MSARSSETFNAFLQDIRDRDPQILSRPVLERRISDAKNLGLSPEERTQARTEILDSVIRIIPATILRYGPLNIPPEELVGEAYETVDRCIDIFAPDSTTSFPSYVYYSLTKKLRRPRTTIDLDQPFNIPAYRKGDGFRMLRAFTPIAQDLQHEPTRDEWFERTEFNPTLDRWEQYKQKSDFEALHHLVVKKPFIRIGHEVSSGQIDPDNLGIREGVIEEVLADPANPNLEDVDKHLDLKPDIEKALEKLTPRQQQVVKARLSSDRFRTTAEIASELGVTAADISQIWRTALKKLRKPLKPYLWY